MRSGEKLYEELIIGNDPKATQHPRIMKAHESCMEADALDDLIAKLVRCREANEAILLLKALVPEFDHGRDNVVIEKAS